MNATEKRNVQLIRDVLDAADRGDLDVDDYYAKSYVDHHPSPGRSLAAGVEGVRQAVRIFHQAFPDTKHAIHQIFARDDRVVAHISAEGTHSAELMGIAATGKRVFLEAIAIYRIESGRIAERWCFQGKGILEQLRGEVPTAS